MLAQKKKKKDKSICLISIRDEYIKGGKNPQGENEDWDAFEWRTSF